VSRAGWLVERETCLGTKSTSSAPSDRHSTARFRGSRKERATRRRTRIACRSCGRLRGASASRHVDPVDVVTQVTDRDLRELLHATAFHATVQVWVHHRRGEPANTADVCVNVGTAQFRCGCPTFGRHASPKRRTEKRWR
jgi:hypothetical protein